ncbi:pimeloyl-ACP methyl ester carboxylesterase [Promicromonospora sp. AC04]|uniref:alpha/beta fold hydrolase n=1 Tax=Promicromonospora sp. AC04 TaxID=2135723 RepID=UPI000D390759|nr:alpha/beta hydrolase [Promicromonospora sp. AC04]PUB27181.1 pimeloyl-ACP methyl ester carboxylesterase [Promicromonospora sp. AC04]
MTHYATTSQGDRVAYDLYGGSGPALVFVAGAGPYRAVDPITTPTARLVADAGLTAVVFDRLGRGESPADGRLDLERELAAVAAMIDVAGGSAVLCGHSSGCSISLAAADAGLPVDGLALWEAPLGEPADKTRTWADEILRHLDAEDYVGATEKYMEDMPPEWLAGMKSAPDWPESAKSSRSQRADAQSLAWAQQALEDGTLDITVPVLAMYGTATFPEMPVAAASIVASVEQGAEKELPGAMHSWEPEPMAAELAAFARACAG